MTEIKRLLEGSTATLAIVWKDEDGEAVTPSSVEYRIDCLTTGQEVRAKTSATPGADIAIDENDTAILGAGGGIERRELTALAKWTGGQLPHVVRYDVVPLRGYPLD